LERNPAFFISYIIQNSITMHFESQQVSQAWEEISAPLPIQWETLKFTGQGLDPVLHAQLLARYLNEVAGSGGMIYLESTYQLPDVAAAKKRMEDAATLMLSSNAENVDDKAARNHKAFLDIYQVRQAEIDRAHKVIPRLLSKLKDMCTSHAYSTFSALEIANAKEPLHVQLQKQFQQIRETGRGDVDSNIYPY
jgi:hypothetical protein